MKKLAKQLTKLHMKRRECIVKFQRDILISIRRILGKDETTPSTAPYGSCAEERLTVHKNCSTYDFKKKCKTQYMCFECKAPIYLECSNMMFSHCREQL